MGKLKPLRGYVLIEQIEDELKTASGVILPESSKDKPSKGIVVEIGLGECKCVPEGFVGNFQHKGDCGFYKQQEVTKGDKVIFKKWSVTDLEEEGKKLAFVRFEDILGRYE